MARSTGAACRTSIARRASCASSTPGAHYLVFLGPARPSQAAIPDPSPVQLSVERDALRTQIHLRAGERVVALVHNARDEGEAHALLGSLVGHEFDADLDETVLYWRDWSSRCRYQGPYQADVSRSALALKLCTFEPTGAIIAAPTTSLPEQIGGVRNWDYRYTWLRDSAFTVGALAALGYQGEARDFVHFLHDLQPRSGSDLHVLYSILGHSGPQLAEQTLDHLEGYCGSRPVRIGNGAAEQHQLDIYGELLEA